MVKHGFNANLYVEGYMRKEATQKEDQYKIWMTDDELEELLDMPRTTGTILFSNWVAMLGFVLSRYRRSNLSTSNGPLTATITVYGSRKVKIRLATVESRETPTSPVPSSLISIGSSILRELIVLSRLSILHRGLSARS